LEILKERGDESSPSVGATQRVDELFEVGYHLERYHLDNFCEEPDQVFNADEEEVLEDPPRAYCGTFSRAKIIRAVN